jgi:uncharacterized phage protein gp47/JayE
MSFDSGFSRPSLQTLIDRVQTDINSRLSGADSRLRRAALTVIGRVLAGLAHGLYGFLDFISRQVFPDSAITEFLDRWAAIWAISRKAATKATGTVTITGSNGTVIDSGTVLRRGDGLEYVTTASGIISGGTVAIAIEASTAAEAGNAAINTVLSFSSPVSGANATGTTSALTGGTDTESDDSLRARLLARIQEPPHGGAKFDYEAWTLSVAGVTRVWVYPLEEGEGTVIVRFMMDDTYTNGIPLAGDVTTVQTYLESVRPVTADVTAVAPIAAPMNFTIDLGTDDTAEIRAAVEAELKDMLRRDAKPGGTILVSRIREAISIAAGETDHVLTTPNANVTHTTGQIATMGTITWT